MNYTVPMFAAALMAATISADAASVVVDWLVSEPGGTVSAFTLVDDANAAAATGSATITAGVGYPGLPTSRTFASGSWTTQPELQDTLTSDTTISALEFRVVPSLGFATYVINLQVPSNQPLIVVVGGLLKNSTSSTQGIEIAALSDLGAVPVTQQSTHAWSNGLTVLNQPTDWNPLTQVLSPTSVANGDSEFAIFEVGPISGANPRMSFTVPLGYAASIGDSIFIGMGKVIPEPSTAGLLLLGAGALAGRRNRRG